MLYIESSPRKDRSASIEVARAFVDEYKVSHLGDAVDSIDLWKESLPEFDGDVINAKYVILHGEEHTDAQKKTWNSVETIIDGFKHADKYLLSLPMWNFGIPYKLKHYIDILVQPTYTFSFTPEEGYAGLVTGKPAALIYARGGAYGTGSGGEDYDLQKRYMEQILRFIGFTDIQSVLVEPTFMASPEDKFKIIEAAKVQARTLAKDF